MTTTTKTKTNDVGDGRARDAAVAVSNLIFVYRDGGCGGMGGYGGAVRE